MFGSFKMLKFVSPVRSICTASVKCSKQIKVTKGHNKMIVEGVPNKDEQKNTLYPAYKKNPFKSLNIHVEYTDVLILRQFLDNNGAVLPINMTGLSYKSQLTVELLIERSKRAGLLPIKIAEDGQQIYRDPGIHKFNVYYNSRIVGIPERRKLFPPFKLED